MDLLRKIKSNIVKMRKYTKRYNNEILDSQSANNLISNLIKNNKPCMVTRIGSVELECIVEYLYKKKFSKKTAYKMLNNAGFFPNDERNLKSFCELFLSSLEDTDLMGIWYNYGEDKVINKYCNKLTKLCELKNLEPYYHDKPWSKNLFNKNVLVIHPFAQTIEHQYKNYREDLFENKEILPEFNLYTIKAVQSIAGNKVGFKDWFEALDYMKSQINEIDFDVAIIGAGAYGLPLASYIKHMGKVAIHLGGATQIMFGIKGKRWDNHPYISRFYNNYWTRPASNEIPENFNKVENGCYW